MKLDSKLFDRIRIRPDAEATARARFPACEWPGCEEAGEYRAPKGRHREGQYHRFCLGHVQLYNKNYNYFAGMSDASVAAYQKAALTGHRPTWTMGVNPWGEKRGGPEPGGRGPGFGGPFADPLDLFGERIRPEIKPEPRRRVLKPLEKKALDALALDEDADAAAIKARYKELVKRHHPDANGGDRSSEERFREIIAAYNTLKSSGHV